MSIEIKFRVWNKRYKRFDYWGHTEKGTFTGVPSGIDNMGIDETCNKSEWYTGLKDKNGKGCTELYEGDIIDNTGFKRGSLHEVDKRKTDIIIPRMGTKEWYMAYKKAMVRGYNFAE